MASVLTCESGPRGRHQAAGVSNESSKRDYLWSESNFVHHSYPYRPTDSALLRVGNAATVTDTPQRSKLLSVPTLAVTPLTSEMPLGWLSIYPRGNGNTLRDSGANIHNGHDACCSYHIQYAARHALFCKSMYEATYTPAKQ